MSEESGEPRHTDQRRAGLPVLLGTAAVCLAVFAAGSFHRTPGRSAPPRLESTPAGISMLLREYEETENWGELLRTIERVPPSDNMLPAEQHDYYRLAPQTYERFRMHAKAASMYRKYLEWSAMIHAPECGPCHTPPNGHFPGTVAEMMQVAGGERYVRHLNAERQVAATTKKLETLVEKAPNDPRPRLVLYHLLRWQGDAAGAADQAKWLQQFDVQFSAPAANTPR